MPLRVVVTGLGVISPLGIGFEEMWEALIAGRSGIGPVTLFDASPYPSRIGGEVKDFNPADFLDRKEARRMDRFAQFAVVAAQTALTDAHLSIAGEDEAYRTGVFVASGIGGMQTLEKECRVYFERGPSRVSPFFIPMMIGDMAAGQISILTGAKGPNAAVVTACASAAHSLAAAFYLIQRGAADVMIGGGTEAAINGLAYAGFCSAGALSTANEAPERASRPFDAKRDGFVMSEGAGVLILESLAHAKARGARIRAEMVGAGMTSDAYHITAPHPSGEGAARAMTEALRDAGLRPEEVDYINAHGTSTEANDKVETLAIKQALGDHAHRVAISSTKSMAGHLLGAAGGMEAAVCVLAIERGIIPPTINYENPDPECDLDYVPNTARRADVRVALTNSLGFGGHNACLAFKRFTEDGDDR